MIEFQKLALIAQRCIALLIFLTGTHLFAKNLSGLDHAMVSTYAVRVNTTDVLIDQNSDLSLIPGSCIKIVTTAAALHLLGEEYRFETHLKYDGLIDHNKTLHGNLYVQGGGDPCLGSDRIPGSLSLKKQIDAWADAIEKLGIERIEGKIIGDATKWEKALAVPSWNWEDLGNYYGAGACALSFHENCYSLIFKPGNEVGENTTILRTDPPLSMLSFRNEVRTGPKGSGDRACIYGSEFSPVQFVRGTVPAGVDEFSIKGAIPDPPAYVADLLTQELQQRGLVIGQRDIKQQNKKVTFHTTYSPTVKQIVYWTNQKSINLYAEHLLKKMGEVMYNEGSTTSGIKAVTKFWSSLGIDLAGFNMVDGSGLSRKNLITTKQFVQMLSKIKKSDFFPIFFESLPKEENGVRAKSGSMSLIKGCVGYRGDVVFAIVINQCSNRQMLDDKIDYFISDLK